MDRKPQNDKIRLFEGKRIRTAWDEEIVQLKMTAPDGKKRFTDMADTKQALIHKQQNLWAVTTGKPLKPQGFEGFLYPENHSLGEWFKRGCCR